MKVTIDEIVEVLRLIGGVRYDGIANRIEAHGIEQPSGEPVAWIKFHEDGNKSVVLSLNNPTVRGWNPLYTAPPSIDALIAEAVAKEREVCAFVCERIDAEYDGHGVTAIWCADAIRARGQK